METITNIDLLVKSLTKDERKRFKRIFSFEKVLGRLTLPKSGFIRRQVRDSFGSQRVVKRQKIIKITNSITHEGALFNELRNRRPVEMHEKVEFEELIKKNDDCPFCSPSTHTPEDVFGRVQGRYCITASNIAKYDGFHGLVIFDEHNPFELSHERVSDYVETALEWYRKANAVDGKAVYPFFMWNCLWKSGASIVHGHAQVALSRRPYSKVEYLRKVSHQYKKRYKSDYFEDLFAAHSSVGLGLQNGDVKVMVYLTPIKEKEVIMVSPAVTEQLKDSVYRVLTCYLTLGVRSFNMAIIMPPLNPLRGWEDYPSIVRIVDRSDPLHRNSDIATMELYGASVVSSDPFKVMDALRKYF